MDTPPSPHAACCGHEAVTPQPKAAAAGVYTCPMHPEVRQNGPGPCPICGMALEPAVMTAEEDTSELSFMQRRLWVAAALCLPLMGMTMAAHFGLFHESHALGWVQAMLAAPVVWWCGWPFFERAAVSLASRKLNMFTLVALGVGVSYIYSFWLMLMPHAPMLYFESAAVITALVLFGQVLELQARAHTGAAIRALMRLVPDTARVLQEGGD
ncbi:MAG: copper-transporting ATPase, partial [Rickettsiales bacterium]|nr:copper-transporting ATPase [Rickettsiales bacterium]